VHQHFGHISYNGLQKLYDLKLVNRSNVDMRTPKPDCITCTKAKQHVKTFNKIIHRTTAPGELTHINLWGKYSICSIQGNYYYVVLVDNQNRKPKAIRVNHRKEFLSDQLKDWCDEHRIEIQLTTPYSPSQNGIAERMNHELVGLACYANKHRSPRNLWESAITHVSYLRN